MGVVSWEEEVPGWMAKIKAQDDAARDRADADARDQALLNALMRTADPGTYGKGCKPSWSKSGAYATKLLVFVFP